MNQTTKDQCTRCGEKDRELQDILIAGEQGYSIPGSVCAECFTQIETRGRMMAEAYRADLFFCLSCEKIVDKIEEVEHLYSDGRWHRYDVCIDCVRRLMNEYMDSDEGTSYSVKPNSLIDAAVGFGLLSEGTQACDKCTKITTEPIHQVKSLHCDTGRLIDISWWCKPCILAEKILPESQNSTSGD